MATDIRTLSESDASAREREVEAQAVGGVADEDIEEVVLELEADFAHSTESPRYRQGKKKQHKSWAGRFFRRSTGSARGTRKNKARAEAADKEVQGEQR